MRISTSFLPVFVRGDSFRLYFFTSTLFPDIKSIFKGNRLLNVQNYTVILFVSNYFHKKLSN